ncbi:MAG: hypothetical protein KAJ49_03480 [Arcobacteraceae bacterium]|nr:hypothetical protein [Arcobacteraceae bacterium]
MKKNFLPIFLVFGIIVIIVVVFISMSNVQSMVVRIDGNIDKKPLEIKLNHYQDSDCGMVIDDIKYASQVISPKGVTWFFHDFSGLVNWVESKSFKDEAIIWVHAIDTNNWIDGKKAWYTRDEITPMESGFGAYTNKKDGLITFEQMRLYILRGETMINPAIKKQLLELKTK